MENNPKVSVVIATYNGSKYIRQQVQSILTQTYLPFEVIVCDDASTDNTLAIVESMFKELPIVLRIIDGSKQVGHVQNFNKGLMVASGDYVALCDQDDVWVPEKIEKAILFFQDVPNCAVYMHDAVLCDESLRETKYTKLQQLKSSGLDVDDYWMGCVSMFKADYLRTFLPIPEGVVSHDVFLIEPARALKKVYVDFQPLIKYRRHQNNVSSGLRGSSSVTKKSTRLRAFVASSVSFLEHDHIKSLDTDIICLSKTINAYELSLRFYIGDELIALKLLLDEMKKRINIQSIRKKNCKEYFFRRLSRSIILLVKGEYKNVSGIQSFLRDIFS